MTTTILFSFLFLFASPAFGTDMDLDRCVMASTGLPVENEDFSESALITVCGEGPASARCFAALLGNGVLYPLWSPGEKAAGYVHQPDLRCDAALVDAILSREGVH